MELGKGAGEASATFSAYVATATNPKNFFGHLSPQSTEALELESALSPLDGRSSMDG